MIIWQILKIFHPNSHKNWTFKIPFPIKSSHHFQSGRQRRPFLGSIDNFDVLEMKILSLSQSFIVVNVSWNRYLDPISKHFYFFSYVIGDVKCRLFFGHLIYQFSHHWVPGIGVVRVWSAHKTTYGILNSIKALFLFTMQRFIVLNNHWIYKMKTINEPLGDMFTIPSFAYEKNSDEFRCLAQVHKKFQLKRNANESLN